MASKSKFFPWSKARQPALEPYHRTGGLLPIDTSVGDSGKEVVVLAAAEAETTDDPARRRPPNLTIVSPDYTNTQYPWSSPVSPPQSASLVKSASNLLAVVNDMLRSPTQSATLCSGSAPAIHKPLPSRPRSMSLPSTPEPAELPGSILLENQGFPSPPPVAGLATPSTMRSIRSGNSISSSAATRPSPSKVPQHRKSLSETSLLNRSKSRPNLITSPSSTDSKLTTCSVSTNGGHSSSADSSKARVGEDKSLQPSPLIVEGKPWKKPGGGLTNRRDDLGKSGTPTPSTSRSKQVLNRVEELKSTITAQDQTISTLQAQFASLRVSHEAHLASLIDTHAAEIASLRNYTKALEDQQAQRTLHHASSNHLLFLLDTTEPHSPTRENSQNTAIPTSATSVKSFKTAFEQQPRTSPLRSRNSPEMENLKRKLSTARRPETGNGDMIRELNMYKQNNGALQRQVESLMTKLNQSKEEERKQKRMLEDIQKTCDEWQEKASNNEQLEKSALALQNTIDHLEHRLEMANCEKVDAEEQLFNLQSQRSPFDAKPPPRLQVPQGPIDNRQSTRTSMSTVFANESPISQHDPQEPTTLAAFISHIERLQEQIREKDVRNAELETKNAELQGNYDRLQSEHRELTLQSEIQGQLLLKGKRNEIHIEELRDAIMQRESIIGEKSKALHQAERQLEHHKLLLEADVKRHAKFTIAADTEDDPLPDLTSLASKEDIDRWIERLEVRMKKEIAKKEGKEHIDSLESTIADLRKEIDFYVREIIYYKLDVRGYKSDIKKLKRKAAQGDNYGRPSDVSSPDPSVCRSTDTPIRRKFLSGTSGTSGTTGLGISGTPSPVFSGPTSAALSMDRPMTPLDSIITSDEPVKTGKPSTKRVPKHLHLRMPTSPRTPTRRAGINLANEADNVDPGISPRSVPKLSPERRKPTPPSPDQEKFGDMATNFPLSTPASPKRHIRSMSESGIIQLYAQPWSPEWLQSPKRDEMTGLEEKRTSEARSRSISNPEPTKGKATPERPPRPRLGLFDSPIGAHRAVSSDLPTPLRMDVMAKAMQNSPDREKPTQQFPERKLSNSSASGIPHPSTVRSSNSTPSPAIHPTMSLRSRGSANSSTANMRAQAASLPRSPSTSSNSNVPFVIAMGSPHNPALIAPTASVLPTPCSITGKVLSPTLRSGVGGTMASTTPIMSPVSPGDTSKPLYINSNIPPMRSQLTPPSSKPNSATPSRNPSISSATHPTTKPVTSPTLASASNPKSENQPVFNTSSFAAPTASSRSKSSTPSHSRNASGSSIRQAINLPGKIDFIKGKGKSRKDSIGHPTPLASPFDIDRSTRKEGGVGGSI